MSGLIPRVNSLSEKAKLPTRARLSLDVIRGRASSMSGLIPRVNSLSEKTKLPTRARLSLDVIRRRASSMSGLIPRVNSLGANFICFPLSAANRK